MKEKIGSVRARGNRFLFDSDPGLFPKAAGAEANAPASLVGDDEVVRFRNEVEPASGLRHMPLASGPVLRRRRGLMLMSLRLAVVAGSMVVSSVAGCGDDAMMDGGSAVDGSVAESGVGDVSRGDVPRADVPRRDTGTSEGRPPIEDILPPYFGFGVSSFGRVLDWPGEVAESHGINWDFLYWYQNAGGDHGFLEAKIRRAEALGAIPVITHYQLLERGREAGYSGDEEWDVVLAAVQDDDLMRGYYENVEWIMRSAGSFEQPVIFQTEPDSTSWLRLFHTGGTNDANNGAVSVASSGHPDLSGLPNTIAGYAQALVRLRDLYAPNNVYMGLCEFDNRNGNNPEYSVQFIQSLGVEWDLLFTHHVVKYSTRGEGWWDAVDEVDQSRFVTWIETISRGTGLKYMHWQTVIGASDYGLMPNYPEEERISDLVGAGSVGNLFDLYRLDGPPHSQPQHGYTSSPSPDHPAYNSLDRLAERLQSYYRSPVPL